MPTSKRRPPAQSDPEKQLDSFLDKYSPEIAAVGRATRARMRKLLPTAHELVYDNYNALAIGYSPTEKASDGIFSIALYTRWVRLFFLQGAGLPDPDGPLEGSGSTVRSIRLTSGAADLDKPAVKKLIAVALKAAKTPIDPKVGPGTLLIKSISAKQRPRR